MHTLVMAKDRFSGVGKVIVALIHWRIKPDETSIADFLRFWREDATVADRGELVGEFLSEVATPREFS
jgi:hypothetical protein